MKHRFLKPTVMLAIALILSLTGYSQVTIGSGIEPVGGALLDLKEKTPSDPTTDNATATKGLMLPRVNLTDLSRLSGGPDGSPAITGVTENPDDHSKHTGLTVYHIGTCLGVYVWTGSEWIKAGEPCPCYDPDPATVSPDADVTVYAVAGSSFTLGAVSVSFTSGSPNAAYQWYSNTSKSTSGATMLTGETSNTLVATEPVAGTYYYYCEITNGDCSSTSVQTGFYTVLASPPGTGNFTGKTCFDIAVSNFDGGCGTEAVRLPQKTDFSLQDEQDPQAGTGNPVYTGRQVYTFTPSGNVSNVRFTYLDASGVAIASMTAKGDYSGNISSGQLCKAVVIYQATLNQTLRGKNRDQALKPQLYVIYNDLPGGAGTERSIRLTVSLQDCLCCEARTAGGGWLTFMCHNLGADESLDPLTWVTYGDRIGNDIKGDLYQWGRPKDGHEQRNSPVTTTLATNPEATAPESVVGRFIIGAWDWLSGGGHDDRWGDGTSRANPIKAPNDPCPPGWKVPSRSQLRGLFDLANGREPSESTVNAWSWVGYGLLNENGLYLPAAGGRNGLLGHVDKVHFDGYYLTSSAVVTDTRHWIAQFAENYYQDVYTDRTFGMSVRCVTE
jgi:uncharacterized protein (TIGR02145 family)